MGQAKQMNRLYRYIAKRAATRRDAECAIGTIQAVLNHSFRGHWPLYEWYRCEAIHTAVTIEAICQPVSGQRVDLIRFVWRQQAGDLSALETGFTLEVKQRFEQLMKDSGCDVYEKISLIHIVLNAMLAAGKGCLPCRQTTINCTVYRLLLLCVGAFSCGQMSVAHEAVRALNLLRDCVPLQQCGIQPNVWSVLAG